MTKVLMHILRPGSQAVYQQTFRSRLKFIKRITSFHQSYFKNVITSASYHLLGVFVYLTIGNAFIKSFHYNALCFFFKYYVSAINFINICICETRIHVLYRSNNMQRSQAKIVHLHGESFAHIVCVELQTYVKMSMGTREGSCKHIICTRIHVVPPLGFYFYFEITYVRKLFVYTYFLAHVFSREQFEIQMQGIKYGTRDVEINILG